MADIRELITRILSSAHGAQPAAPMPSGLAAQSMLNQQNVMQPAPFGIDLATGQPGGPPIGSVPSPGPVGVGPMTPQMPVVQPGMGARNEGIYPTR